MVMCNTNSITSTKYKQHSLVRCRVICNYYYIRDLRVFNRREDVAKDRNTRGTSSMDCRKRGSHARGVYPTQYTLRMGTARVKEKKGADTRIIVKG